MTIGIDNGKIIHLGLSSLAIFLVEGAPICRPIIDAIDKTTLVQYFEFISVLRGMEPLPRASRLLGLSLENLLQSLGKPRF